MITLTASGGSVVFTFTNSTYYLYGDGTITVPVNSLSLVIDNSGAATFRKAVSNDIFVSAPLAEFGMSKAEIEEFYKENMVGSTGGGGGGVTSGEVQTMIDESISGKADTSSLATVATTGDYDDLLNKPTIPTVPTSNTAFTNDAGYITEDALSGYAESSAVTAVNDVLTAHTANTDVHVTSSEKSTWNAKSDFSGSYNDLTDKPTIPTVPTDVSAFNNDAGYITEDAISGKADTSALTAVNNVLTAHTANTTVHVTASEKNTWNSKQDALVSGTNIKTINNQSLLGSGNIDIQGGGGSYTAGEGISIENDEISTSYTGYTVFDSGTTEPEMHLSSFEGQCLILCPIDCEGSTDGVAHFDVDFHTYNFTFYPETQTYDDNGDSSWQDYFTLEWNNTYGAFMLTTNENQPIDASDDGCVRFLTSEIRYSGTTTDGINGALEVATKVDKQLGGLKFVRLTQDEYDALSQKDSDTLYIIVPAFGGLTVYYSIDGAAAQNEITLFNGGGDSSGESSGGGGALPSTMIVDGVDETPVNTWRFEYGTHIVQYTFEDNTVPEMFLNGIDYAYEIEIGDDITTIADSFAGDGVFAGMPALQKATIGKNVTTIGDYAFNTSFNLGTNGIYVKATTPPTLGSGAFDNTDNCPIIVPTGTYVDYTSDISWSVYGQRIAEL